MLLELIAQYYKLFWIGLAVLAFLKVILSYAFHGKLEGMNGVIFALFIWYNSEQQEMEEFSGRRTTMRFLNIITIGMYGMILLLITANILPRILGR